METDASISMSVLLHQLHISKSIERTRNLHLLLASSLPHLCITMESRKLAQPTYHLAIESTLDRELMSLRKRINSAYPEPNGLYYQLFRLTTANITTPGLMVP
jgi:hypothetical protein